MEQREVVMTVLNAAQFHFTNGHRPQYDDGVIDLAATLIGLENDPKIVRMALRAVASRDPAKIKQASQTLSKQITSEAARRIEADVLYGGDTKYNSDDTKQEVDDDDLR